MTFWGGSGSGSGSAMPQTNGSGCGSGSFYFRQWPSQDANKKLFFYIVFLLITLWRYMYIIFKDKKSKRCHKAVQESRFFLLFLLSDRRIQIRIRSQIRIHTSEWWIRIRIQEAQKHVDPVDPDPQHSSKICFMFLSEVLISWKRPASAWLASSNCFCSRSLLILCKN
jgi:hypothetical protein